MPRYIDWAILVARFPEADKLGDASLIDTYLIPVAETEIDRRLAGVFSVPFSNNNATVRDLVTVQCMANAHLGKNDDKHRAYTAYVDARIKEILAGGALITDSGAAYYADAGEPVYSPTMRYPPIFNSLNPIDWAVNSQQQYDEAHP